MAFDRQACHAAAEQLSDALHDEIPVVLAGNRATGVGRRGSACRTGQARVDCIEPLGMFVSFGSASGPIDAFNINLLQTKGSLFATRPTLNTYAAKREDLLKIANDLGFGDISSGEQLRGESLRVAKMLARLITVVRRGSGG